MKTLSQWIEEKYPEAEFRPVGIIPPNYRIEYLQDMLIEAFGVIDALEQRVAKLEDDRLDMIKALRRALGA